jgi:hypothetical protein
VGWHRTPQLARFLRFHEVELFQDFEEFCAVSARAKIVFEDFDSIKISSELTVQQLRDYVSRLADIADWVFIVETEMAHHDYVLLADPGYKPPANVRWLMPGTVAGREQHIISWQYHLWRIADIYRRRYGRYLIYGLHQGILAQDLDRLKEPKERNFVFDALLGTPRNQRVWFRDQVKDLDCRSNIMLRVLPSMHIEHDSDINSETFHVEPEWDFRAELYRGPTVAIIPYRGYDVVVSNIIPVSAYQQCWFSIISETACENHTHMVTEKTAKVLLAQRVFLPIVGSGYMRYLESQGFRTFGSVIDQSYDDIQPNHDRWRAMIQEIRRICHSDPAEILQQCLDMVTHNQNVMLTKDFVRPVLDEIEALIEPTIHPYPIPAQRPDDQHAE